MSAWESALERFLVLDGNTKPARDNPYPPLGRGLKPRPPLLEIPNFTPPPPTPQPLFGFQKPQMNAYTQHLLQQQRQRMYQQEQRQLKEQRQRQPQQQRIQEQPKKAAAAPVRTRRPRIWDLLPDSPKAAAPSKQAQALREQSSTAWGTIKIQQEAVAAGRSGQNQAGVQAEPKHMTAHRESRGVSSGGETATRQSMACDSGRGLREASACSAPEKHSRASLQCGVDLSMLWEVFYEALFFPAMDCSTAAQETASNSPCACQCSCQPSAPVRGLAPGSAPDRFAPVRCQVEEEAIACPVMCDEGLCEDFTTPLADAKVGSSFRSTAATVSTKGSFHRSPMSVLTPKSSEKSSAGSSPCPASLLAFIERDVHLSPVA